MGIGYAFLTVFVQILIILTWSKFSVFLCNEEHRCHHVSQPCCNHPIRTRPFPFNDSSLFIRFAQLCFLISVKFLSPCFLLCFSYCDISLFRLCLLLRLLPLIIPISCPCSM
ncbi:hypothetical protein P691DRAFT_690625 [Macrolepiota fuliginosa MF-IS2]|uniref:Uncharacterized protein n=1 Tax=Macrolepiota fuliginosa MF-IS2 TaxID=1400762 RepID=A0A9P5WVW2_9AGAR|nr:hypothetical protein P691DRAFT_690625 [Macrolepiota fuliginosa MF-IS2]